MREVRLMIVSKDKDDDLSLSGERKLKFMIYYTQSEELNEFMIEY